MQTGRSPPTFQKPKFERLLFPSTVVRLWSNGMISRTAIGPRADGLANERLFATLTVEEFLELY